MNKPTLREVREKNGLLQSDVAKLINTYTSVISTFESETALPDLEQAIILEKEFNTRIAWKDDLSPRAKHEVVQSVIELCEKYPLPMVAEFFARVYRRNQSPENFILHYAEVTNREPDPMMYLPMGFKKSNNCED